jgi:hypothetical protein
MLLVRFRFKVSYKTLLGFTDCDLVNGSPNEDLPLIIIATIANADISRILIDQGSSSDIMYSELFTRLRIKEGWLQPYHGGPLAAFNGSITQPIGSIILPIMFKKEGDLAYARTIQIRFPVLPCESNYNCILRRTTLKLLGEVSSTIHLKLRYTTRILFISHKNISRNGAQFRRNCGISYHNSYQMVCRYKGTVC